MSRLSKRTLFWSPRLLCIGFICFLALFALDVFGENLGFWRTLLALAMHLIPNAILAVILIVAWRWEWVGTVLFAALGFLYINMTFHRTITAAVRLNWCLVIAGPLFLLAVLFLVNWLKHDELRTA